MRTVRSITFLLFTCLLLTAGPRQIPQADAAPRKPKKIDLADDVTAGAKWFKDFKGKKGAWALPFQVEVKKGSKLIGTICHMDLTYGKNRKKVCPGQQRKVRSHKEFKRRFGPVKYRLAWGEWHVTLTFRDPKTGKVLATVDLRAMRGNAKDIRKAKEAERKWFLKRLELQMGLLDVLLEGDEEAEILGLKKLREMQVAEDPKTGEGPDVEAASNPESDWSKMILAWRNERTKKLDKFFKDYQGKYKRGLVWGESRSKMKALYMDALYLNQAFIAENARSLWWDDVRQEIADEDDKAKAMAAEIEKRAKERGVEPEEVEIPEREVRTGKGQMAKRRRMVAKGYDSYDFKRRIAFFRRELARTHRKMAVLLEMVADSSLGALWNEVAGLQEMDKQLADAYDKAKEGPGKGKFPKARLHRRTWPGNDWTKSLARLAKTFKKYDDLKDPHNVLKDEAPVRGTLVVTIAALRHLRALYLTDLYNKYNVPDEHRTNLPRLPAGTTVDLMKARLKKAFEELGEFFEKKRAAQRQPIERIRATIENLAEEMKQKFDDPKAAELFDNKNVGKWHRAWSRRKQPLSFAIRFLGVNVESKRFFPRAAGILQKAVTHLEKMENLAVMYHVPIEGEGNGVNKPAIAKDLNREYRKCQIALEQMAKELQRRKIDPLVAADDDE